VRHSRLEGLILRYGEAASKEGSSLPRDPWRAPSRPA